MVESDTPDWKRNTVALLNRTDTQVWLLVLTVFSVLVVLFLFPEDWSLGRKLAGGVLTGVGSLFCVFLPRMIGGQDFN